MKKAYYKTLFYLTATAILYLAITNDSFCIIEGRYEDKVNHFFAFFTLSLLLNRSSSTYNARMRNVTALLVFAVFIEFLQYFIPYRCASVGDVIADLGGILTFQFLLTLYRYTKANFSSFYIN